MMKQAQQMQDRLQKQMAEMRVEATAGGGMVTVVMNGAKQVQSLKIDPEAVSKDDVEMLQDLILAAINDAQRKVDEALPEADGRDDGRPEDSRPVLMSRPDPLTRLIEQLQRLPGIGAKSAQRLAFHVLKTPREEVERLAEAMRDVKDRVTYCSVCSNITDTDPCYFCTHPGPRPSPDLRRRGARERQRDREDARLQGRLSRADGRAVAAARRRARRSEDQGPADARRRPAASRK